MSRAPEHLTPSSLGTKAHWDSLYTLELSNFTSQPNDEGTIWFEDASAEERMLSHLDTLADEGLLQKADEEMEEVEGGEEKKARAASRFLDLGTGNGHLLFAAREEGWKGELVGVDYSEGSVDLARRICEKRMADAETEEEEDEEIEEFRFEQWDVLTQEPGDWLEDGFDVVLDKGTFDAISLSEQVDERGRRICEGYRERVEPLVKIGGRFLITSCNWTQEELRAWFEVEGGKLEYEAAVKYPSFTFGGKTGSQVCTLCFKRKA